MLVTGEIGLGKTTLVHALLDQLADTTAIALITNPLLGFEGIVEYMLEDLGVGKPAETSLTQRLIALQHFLVERSRTGQDTLLVIDEAHAIAPEALERIRLLANFETPREKLLQVLLVGQVELRDMLRLPSLRSLDQRIGIRCRLPALTPDQVGAYVSTRVLAAGGSDPGLFSAEALEHIAAYSRGLPRVVNTVCDHCLTFAYAAQTRRITGDTVTEVIRYLDDGRPLRRSRRLAWRPTRRNWAVLATSATLLAGAAAMTAAHVPVERAVNAGVSSLSSVARSVRDVLTP
jgi:general secretion pathway protein A